MPRTSMQDSESQPPVSTSASSTGVDEKRENASILETEPLPPSEDDAPKRAKGYRVIDYFSLTTLYLIACLQCPSRSGFSFASPFILALSSTDSIPPSALISKPLSYTHSTVPTSSLGLVPDFLSLPSVGSCQRMF